MPGFVVLGYGLLTVAIGTLVSSMLGFGADPASSTVPDAVRGSANGLVPFLVGGAIFVGLGGALLVRRQTVLQCDRCGAVRKRSIRRYPIL